VWPFFNKFKFEIFNSLIIVVIGDFSGAINDIPKLVDLKKLIILIAITVTWAVAALPKYSPSLIFVHSN
jgi:hypothetical protein